MAWLDFKLVLHDEFGTCAQCRHGYMFNNQHDLECMCDHLTPNFPCEPNRVDEVLGMLLQPIMLLLLLFFHLDPCPWYSTQVFVHDPLRQLRYHVY